LILAERTQSFKQISGLLRYDGSSPSRQATLMKARRSSTTLTLVLIGAAALHGCGGDEEENATRDVYKSRADCQRDWGDDPAKCAQQTSGAHSGMFYGPLLYGLGRMGGGSGFGSTMAPRQGTNAVGSTHVPGSSGGATRGGFGSSARSHSSGG
jgi:hypothetical protein